MIISDCLNICLYSENVLKCNLNKYVYIIIIQLSIDRRYIEKLYETSRKQIYINILNL